MDSDSDFYYEENSEAEEGFAEPLNIQVNVNLEESPESPPPQPEFHSPILPAPHPVGSLSPDGRIFLNYYNRVDVLELKNWATETRARMNEEGFVVEAPMVSQSFWAFLQYFHGQQWEIKFLKPAAGPLFDQMLAYIVGYARLTSLNKNLLRRSFEGWSASEKAENLQLLAESGGFFEIM